MKLVFKQFVNESNNVKAEQKKCFDDALDINILYKNHYKHIQKEYMWVGYI